MKVKLILLLLLFWAISVVLNEYYRPYIYQNNIIDFGLADVAGNLTSPCAICLLAWIMKWKITTSSKKDVFIFTAIYLIHECLSLFIPFLGTFDFKDLIALTIGGFMSLALHHLLEIENYYTTEQKNFTRSTTQSRATSNK